MVQVEIVTGGNAAWAGGKRKGTGFNIEPYGLIITNRHLVEDATSVTVSFSGQGRYPARRWLCSSEADLAVIYLAGEDLPVVPLGRSLPLPADTVTIIGNPLDFFRIVIRGQVSGYSRLSGAEEAVLEINAPIHPGHSGSPVFNAKGEVVAVIFAARQSGDPPVQKGLALPVSMLEELLE